MAWAGVVVACSSLPPAAVQTRFRQYSMNSTFSLRSLILAMVLSPFLATAI
jgi:hypothetical protein